MKNQGDLITLTKNWMDYVDNLATIIIAIIALIGFIGAVLTAKGFYHYLQEDNTRNQATIIGYLTAFIVCSLMTISPVLLAAIGLLYVKG